MRNVTSKQYYSSFLLTTSRPSGEQEQAALLSGSQLEYILDTFNHYFAYFVVVVVVVVIFVSLSSSYYNAMFIVFQLYISSAN